MNNQWILNASPIILLGKANLLKTISPVASKWIIPVAVRQEVERKASLDFYLSDLSSKSEVTREEELMVNPSVAAWNLGQGESQVLTLALEKPGLGVVLDDLQARKCAIIHDIPLIGSLGLIVLAKRKGLLPAAKQAIDQLIVAGLYIDSKMINRILSAIGEGETC